MDQLNLDAWTNRSDVAAGAISEQQSQMINAVFATDGQPVPKAGEPVPHLWHWYAFPPTAQMSELGEDGHPKLGGFMPPLQLNRRMWAGGNLEFHRPIHVGERLERRITIAEISEKSGAAGKMVIVRLDHEVSGASGVAVVERQNVVYLQIPESFTPPKKVPAPDAAPMREKVDVTGPLLFRYSAITFNAHRIHYDLRYTQEVEHYPDLVVHGPLQAQLLMNMATREKGKPPTRFSFRGVHPLFANDGLEIQALQETATEWSLCAVAGKGHQTTQASAIWED